MKNSKIEIYRYIIGGLAALCVIFSFIGVPFSTILLISEVTFFPSIISFILLSIICFFIYGRNKNNLIKVTILLFSLANVIAMLGNVYIPWHFSFTNITSMFYTTLNNADLFYLIILIFINISIFRNKNISNIMKFLLVISLLLTVVCKVALFILVFGDDISFDLILFYFFQYAPYLFFTIFICMCPLDYVSIKIKKDELSSRFQKKELSGIDDLATKLKALEMNFEKGYISQEEYTNKRKALIDSF